MIPVVSDVLVGLEQVGDFPEGDVHICLGPPKSMKKQQKGSTVRCKQVHLRVCQQLSRICAPSRYSPRAFMYSSKLSLEIIFQYPFRSTGMLAVSRLLSGLPVKQGAVGWVSPSTLNSLPNASIWTKLDLIRLRAFHFSQVRLPLHPFRRRKPFNPHRGPGNTRHVHII